LVRVVSGYADMPDQLEGLSLQDLPARNARDLESPARRDWLGVGYDWRLYRRRGLVIVTFEFN
jgi:hypothetical protein